MSSYAASALCVTFRSSSGRIDGPREGPAFYQGGAGKSRDALASSWRHLPSRLPRMSPSFVWRSAIPPRASRPPTDERPLGELSPRDVGSRRAISSGCAAAQRSPRQVSGRLERRGASTSSGASLAPLVLALVPLFWVADATHRVVADDARPRPGHLPVHRVGCPQRRRRLPRRARRQRPARSPHPHGRCSRSAAPTSIASTCSSSGRPGVVVRVRRRAASRASSAQRAPEVAGARRLGASPRGSSSRRSTHSTSTGTKRSARASATGSSCRASRSRSRGPRRDRARDAVVARSIADRGALDHHVVRQAELRRSSP